MGQAELFPDGMKRCRSCGSVKPVADFALRYRSSFRREPRCRTCSKSQASAVRARHRAKNASSYVPWKRCPRCGQTKQGKDFRRARSNASGLSTYCQACDLDHYRRMRRGLYRFLDYLLSGVARRSRDRGWPMDITTKDLLELWTQQKGRCIYTGIQMQNRQAPRRSSASHVSTSVDRIDTEKPYVRANIQLVCTWANMAKADLPDKDFRHWLRLAGRHLAKKKRHEKAIVSSSSPADADLFAM